MFQENVQRYVLFNSYVGCSTGTEHMGPAFSSLSVLAVPSFAQSTLVKIWFISSVSNTLFLRSSVNTRSR